MTGWEGVKAAAESGAAVALVEGGDCQAERSRGP